MPLNVRRTIVLAVAAVLLVPGAARAQAWVLADGEGTVSILYHHLFVEDHIFSRGERHDSGAIRMQLMTVDVEYGLTDRLSLRAVLPYAASKYTGSAPHVHAGGHRHGHTIDDGATRAAFQDFRAEARYGWREFPVAISPFVGITLPTHDYEFFGHSAIGPRMRELQLGTYVGLRRGSMMLQGKVAYGIYERVVGRRRNRVMLDAEVAWAAGRRVQLSLFEAGQISHGGVELHLADVRNRTIARPDWWPHHDQLGRADVLNLGGGLSVRVTPSVTVHGTLMTTVAGRNTHAAKYGATGGATWAFGGPRGPHPTANRP